MPSNYAHINTNTVLCLPQHPGSHPPINRRWVKVHKKDLFKFQIHVLHIHIFRNLHNKWIINKQKLTHTNTNGRPGLGWPHYPFSDTQKVNGQILFVFKTLSKKRSKHLQRQKGNIWMFPYTLFQVFFFLIFLAVRVCTNLIDIHNSKGGQKDSSAVQRTPTIP